MEHGFQLWVQKCLSNSPSSSLHHLMFIPILGLRKSNNNINLKSSCPKTITKLRDQTDRSQTLRVTVLDSRTERRDSCFGVPERLQSACILQKMWIAHWNMFHITFWCWFPSLFCLFAFCPSSVCCFFDDCATFWVSFVDLESTEKSMTTCLEVGISDGFEKQKG